MALLKIVLYFLITTSVNSFVLDDKVLSSNKIDNGVDVEKNYKANSSLEIIKEEDIDKELNGVYSECVLHMSFICIQKKTLRYLEKLNQLKEVSIVGDYLKFVKIKNHEDDKSTDMVSEKAIKISTMIDRAVDNFFENRVLRLHALGKDITFPINGEEFVGRKKRKGGGGGGGHDHDDGGKKKMMMMAMMCMKMKFMMMVPAMMGMMGMMSFKGMMFSMMTFMMTKMMLMMKLHEKKGSLGGGGGGDGGWAAGGGGGGAWMPAGGQDYGGGGGYDSNAQWQGRSHTENVFHTNNQWNGENFEHLPDELIPLAETEPVYNKPEINVGNIKKFKPNTISLQNYNIKSRRKRGVIDIIHSAYIYWINKILGINRFSVNYPKYKVINGVRYVYYPLRQYNKKVPKAIPNMQTQEETKATEEFKPISVQDFNKGEIVDSPIATARMHKKKIQKFKQNVEETVDDNPWE